MNKWDILAVIFKTFIITMVVILFILLILVISEKITSKEVCKLEFSSPLEDIRYLDQGNAIFVFNDTLIISDIPMNALFKKGETMDVNFCYKQGVISKLLDNLFFNEYLYYKVEKTK